MLVNAFIGKQEEPSDSEVEKELGSTKPYWDRLLAALTEHCDCDGREWNSYSRKAGWSLKVKRKDRTIVYLSPSRGCFMASFALGDNAVKAARQAKLPASALTLLDHAKRYAEGTAVRIEVHGSKDVAVVEKLAAIKLKN